ncbi:hypothetical protein PSTT_15861 [Puccinia striiformis]|uniref:Uncharacterized protein n=1 Tax=Puccinia striiformis TaxID=27350 RepID=A0A2S4UFY0_9BASI|nr:hypothetical protein PSTT_15861 [Puccinia striiformis]
MNDAGSKGDGKPPMNPESDTMSMQHYLKVVMATQQATMAQAQADREEYTRRLACQDANATNAIPTLPDDVNLCTFRTLHGPAYTGPYQDVEPFLLWLNSLHMFFCSKEITNEHTKIILTGGFIKESNLLGFFATGSKHLLEGTWTDFCKELMATALPSHWKTTIQKPLWFLKMTTSETTVNDKDLAEGITFDLLDVVESDIYKLHLLEEAPFGFSELVTWVTHSYNTTSTSPQRC